MKKIYYRLIVFSLLAAILWGYAAPSRAAANANSIGSLLDSYTAGSEVFSLTAESRLYIVADSQPTTEGYGIGQTAQLIQRQFAADGHTMTIVWGEESLAKAGDIVLKVDPACGIAAEGYCWQVGQIAYLTAPDADGILYGANTLQRMIRAANSTTLQGFTAQDVPDTKERTVQLDVARKYFTKEWICNFIREMSWMGYNTISLHFSEDGGFRADFWDPNYYTDGFQPENDLSWICGSHLQSWVKSPFDKDPDAGKYLTTAEMIEIINVAKEYHMDIIPTFDSPAHMDYLTWKYEQHYKADNNFSFKYNGTTFYAKNSYPAGCINYNGTSGGASPLWPDYTTMELRDEQADYTRGKNAKAFVFCIYEDIADFFKVYAGSTKFSIGADEVNLSSAANAWSYRYFPSYINELNRLLNSKGYTVRMFNDFIKADYLSQFDDNIEIMYWNSPHDPTSGGTNEPDILTVQQLVNDGRTFYNCIQTNTYFVLRVTADAQSSTNTTDARSADCRSWTFYHADEDSIYNEWYPADISEHGDKSEDAADVPTGQIAGGYFLVWNDYASVATQDQVWKGINSEGKWNVIDRMWSNTIKMWNSDVNNTVNYSTYENIRKGFGYFPGYSDCSAKNNLPAAVEIKPAVLADHSQLTQLLAEKLPAGNYTASSYAAYAEAIANAEALNQDPNATQEEINQAVAAINSAKENLVETDRVLTVHYNTTVNGQTVEVKTETYPFGGGTYYIYIPRQVGYQFLRCEGSIYQPLASDDGSGHIFGTSLNRVEVTLWFENQPYGGGLRSLLEDAIPVQGEYTAESWQNYQTALSSAETFYQQYLGENATGITTQKDVDAVSNAVQEAQNALVTDGELDTPIEIELLTPQCRLGKQVGLRIITSPNVQSVSIDGETLTLCVGSVQKLDNGETGKIWLVYFPADQVGTFQYTLRAGTNSQTFSVTVK